MEQSKWQCMIQSDTPKGSCHKTSPSVVTDARFPPVPALRCALPESSRRNAGENPLHPVNRCKLPLDNTNIRPYHRLIRSEHTFAKERRPTHSVPSVPCILVIVCNNSLDGSGYGRPIVPRLLKIVQKLGSPYPSRRRSPHSCGGYPSPYLARKGQ